MRIAFDMDGVLADLHERFAETALRLFPTLDSANLAAPDAETYQPGTRASDEGEVEQPVSPIRPLSRRQSSAVWRELCGTENFWEELDEHEPGMIRRIAALAEERRWEVIFLTSRPLAAGRTVQQQSQRWLARHGFPMPSVYVVRTSRGRIADALELDVVVDDRPDNCLDVVLESKARGILVWRASPGRLPASTTRLGIGVVPTVAACLDLLIAAERETAEGGDFMQRLRRLLGLKTRPRTTPGH